MSELMTALENVVYDDVDKMLYDIKTMIEEHPELYDLVELFTKHKDIVTEVLIPFFSIDDEIRICSLVTLYDSLSDLVSYDDDLMKITLKRIIKQCDIAIDLHYRKLTEK